MDKYLAIYNDNNTLQIDDTFSVLCNPSIRGQRTPETLGPAVVEQARFSKWPYIPGTDLAPLCTSYSYAFPVVSGSCYFLQCKSYSTLRGIPITMGTATLNGEPKVIVTAYDVHTLDGASITPAFKGCISYYFSEEIVQRVLKVYRYGPVDQSPSPLKIAGMQVFDASGKLIFDTEQPPLLLDAAINEKNIQEDRIDKILFSPGGPMDPSPLFNFTEKEYTYDHQVGLCVVNSFFGAAATKFTDGTAYGYGQFPVYILRSNSVETVLCYRPLGNWEKDGHNTKSMAPRISNWTSFMIANFSNS